MTGLNKLDDQWVPLQIAVFTRWVNTQLKPVNAPELKDITQDLYTGVHLVQLAQVLIPKQAPRQWSREPIRNVDMVENCNLAIQMFEDDGVRFVNISGKDINDKNQKLILGLIWSLILKYSISKSVTSKDGEAEQASEKNSKDKLMLWAYDRVQNYPNMKDFKSYDMSMCALIDSYVPGMINYQELDPKDTEKNAKIVNDAMNELGIPVYIYPEDLVKTGDKVDEKTLLTQLSSAKQVLDNLPTDVKDRDIDISQEEIDEDAKRIDDEEAFLNKAIKEEKDTIAKEEADRLAAEKAEQERLAREKAEQERLAREKAEQERLAREKEEQERLARDAAEQERLDKEAAQRSSEFDNLRRIIEQLQHDLSDAQTRASDVRNKADAANRKASDLTAANDALRSENRVLKHTVKMMKDGSKGASERAVVISQIKNEVDDAKNSTNSVQSAQNEMKASLNTMNSNVECLTFEVKKLKDEAAKKKEKEATERALTVNDIDVDQIKGDVSNNMNLTNQLQQENTQLKQTMQGLQTKIDQLTSQINQRANAPVVIPDEYVQRVHDVHTQSSKANRKAADLHHDVEDIKNKNNSTSTCIEQLNAENQSLKDEMRTLKHEIKGLKDAAKEKEVPVEVPVASQIPDDLVDRVDDAQNHSKLANEDADYARNRASCANMKGDSAASKAIEANYKVDLLKIENEKLRSDLKVLKYEVKKIKRDYQEASNTKASDMLKDNNNIMDNNIMNVV